MTIDEARQIVSEGLANGVHFALNTFADGDDEWGWTDITRYGVLSPDYAFDTDNQQYHLALEALHEENLLELEDDLYDFERVTGVRR